MRVIVFGAGGREHALVKALAASPSVSEVHAVPGSDGIALEALCHAVDPLDFTRLGALLDRFSFDLAVIGPEAYLDKGLGDFLRSKGIPTVGPGQTAARLESSKSFAKKFMVESGVPTAAFAEVSSAEDVEAAALKFKPPYVLKLDGLAAGKGVFICSTIEELQEKADQVFRRKSFGSAGKQALLEEFQSGEELSCLVLTNGSEFEILPLMQDHKRLKDKDEGPNTGGMGVVGPLKISEDLKNELVEKVVRPSVKGLERMGLDFKGVLFIGVMMTAKGPSVLEYNVRFGDPEAQGIMPLLDGDWGLVLKDLARGKLESLKWKPLYSACVVLAAPGYPEQPEKGVRIEGDLDHQTPSSYFLHAGTVYQDKFWVTQGGRVLNAVGVGFSLEEALKKAYAQAEAVRFRGLQMRKDLGSGAKF
jgi:phosphoribosylamine--glycine ligase